MFRLAGSIAIPFGLPNCPLPVPDDPNFEMKVPDLFPEEDYDNLSVRLLGMSIVPDIDIIVDEKLT